MTRMPVVAIIGRPNVGKSTLFNRLVGKRDAIVDGTPGVTRDRHYEITEWNGRSFVLIDTGGYMPEHHDEISVAIREQADVAIEESDLVLLLLDAGTPLTEVELQISTALKKSNKPYLVVANKVDNERISLDVQSNKSFYKLGKTPHPISALNSLSIGDLLDEIFSELGEVSSEVRPAEDDIIRLAIVGRPNVGKSSLVNAIIGKNKHIVSGIPGTTRDAIDTDFTYDGSKFKLIDTAGLRRKTKVRENLEFYSTLRTLNTIQECDVAILLIESLEGLAAQDIKILEEARTFKKGIVLVINKWDLVEKTDRTYLDYSAYLDKSLGSTTYLPKLYISAKTKQRVNNVLETARVVHRERCRTVDAEALREFLHAAIVKNHPPAVRGKDIRITKLHQLKTRPPVFVFITNAPELIPSNYRQYLENQMRQVFGFQGVPLSFTFRKKLKVANEVA